MFRRLKQKIEQEGSPNVKSTKSTEHNTSSIVAIHQSTDRRVDTEDEAESLVTNTAVNGQVKHVELPHKSIYLGEALDGSSVEDVEQGFTTSVNNALLSDSSSDIITGSDIITRGDFITEGDIIAKSDVLESNTNNEITITDNSNIDQNTPSVPLTLGGSTPSRRMNLAATVLKYGEEISSKNQIIAELEQQLSMLAVSGGDNTQSESTNHKLRDRIAELDRQELETRGEISSYLRRISELKLCVSKLEVADGNHRTVISELESKLSSGQVEVLLLTNKLQSSTDQMSVLNSELSQLQTHVNTLHKDLELRDKQINEFSSQRSGELSATSIASSTSSRDEGEVCQLKSKLSRVHSLSKQLEIQLEDKTVEAADLFRENRDIKSSLENSKQQALDDLLTVSQEESGLRSELSAHVQKLSALEAQYKLQSRLLAEKQKDMSNMDQALERQLKNSRQEKETLVSNYSKQIRELEHRCESLALSLATETQTSAKVQEQLDSLREEALDKQLDDEKQLSDLHEQLSVLRGDVRQLERSKRKDIEELHNDLSTKDSLISKLRESSSATILECEAKVGHLCKQMEELQLEVSKLKSRNEEVTAGLFDTQKRLEAVDAERDDLYLRNADLSSKLEKCKIELKSAQTDHKQQLLSLQQRLLANEELEKSSEQKYEALQEKTTLFETQVQFSDAQKKELDDKIGEIESLRYKLSEQERTIADRTKSLRMQQQTITDLKKTIKKELKGLADGPAQRFPADSILNRSQELIERASSSPALSDLDRCDSPIEDNIPVTAPALHKSQATTDHAYAKGLTQQHRHEVNGFCGHKDINFEYLKNVVFSFLISRDSESLHLVKALAVLLEFTPVEEKLLKETVEWKMSWWPSAKKPSNKFRK